MRAIVTLMRVVHWTSRSAGQLGSGFRPSCRLNVRDFCSSAREQSVQLRKPETGSSSQGMLGAEDSSLSQVADFKDSEGIEGQGTTVASAIVVPSKIQTNYTDSYEQIIRMSAQEASYKEARARILLLCASFVACYVVSYTYAEEMLYIITRPFQSSNPKFMFTSMLEALSATNQLCVLASVLACTPLGAYYCWAYFVPTCFQYERAALTAGALKFVGLVYLGTGCSYLVLPRLLHIMLTSSAPFMGASDEGQGGGTGVQYSARIDSYVQLAIRLLLLAPMTAWAAVTKVSLLSGGCVLLMFTGAFALIFEGNVVWAMTRTVVARCKL